MILSGELQEHATNTTLVLKDWKKGNPILLVGVMSL